MNAGDRMTIQFNGKDVEVTFVQAGVVQKTDSIFYVQDSVSGVWGYCFPERLERLRAKYNNDLSGYKNRASKAADKAAAKAAKPVKVKASANAEPVIEIGDEVNASTPDHDHVEA